MKKTKMLIATLVCAVMLMGVGYAWWTDSITLGADVNAGHMNVIWDNAGWMPLYGGSAYVNATIDNETQKNIKFTFGNLYPGAMAFVDAVAKNESTIPVKMSGVTLNTTGNQELLDSIYTTGFYYRTNAQGQFINGSFGSIPYDSLANLDDNLYAAFQDVTLNVGDEIFFGVPEGYEGADYTAVDYDKDGNDDECIIFFVDPNAEEEIEDKDAEITLKFDWKQFNQW